MNGTSDPPGTAIIAHPDVIDFATAHVAIFVNHKVALHFGLVGHYSVDAQTLQRLQMIAKPRPQGLRMG
jgi:hypothetical protein